MITLAVLFHRTYNATYAISKNLQLRNAAVYNNQLGIVVVVGTVNEFDKSTAEQKLRLLQRCTFADLDDSLVRQKLDGILNSICMSD